MRNRLVSRTLIWALALSALAHLLLIGRLAQWTDWDVPVGIPIEVRLVEAPRPAAPPPQPAPEANPRPAAKPRKAVNAAPPVPLPPAAAAETAPAVQPPAPEAASALPAPPAQAREEEAPPAAADAEPAAPPEAQPGSPPPEEAAVPPPRHVEIEYRILRKGGVAGVEHHSYRVREDGSYSLSSLAQAKGLLALALSDLTQKSEGVVTERGLQPREFVYQYGKNPDKAQRAMFDWHGRTLVMQNGARRQVVPLQEGTQDLMSFMYQFMFVPPLQEMRLTITNGKRLRTYDYGFEGEETLNTQMGPLRCIHIARSSGDGEEKTELWLAADYHYLPVKLSKTDEDGTVTERIASSLQIE